jgi:hypothetical protein
MFLSTVLGSRCHSGAINHSNIRCASGFRDSVWSCTPAVDTPTTAPSARKQCEGPCPLSYWFKDANWPTKNRFVESTTSVRCTFPVPRPAPAELSVRTSSTTSRTLTSYAVEHSH